MRQLETHGSEEPVHTVLLPLLPMLLQVLNGLRSDVIVRVFPFLLIFVRCDRAVKEISLRGLHTIPELSEDICRAFIIPYLPVGPIEM